MIHIDRNKIPEPGILHSPIVQEKYKQLERIHFLEKLKYSQRKLPAAFDGDLRSNLLHHLNELFNRKCAYCESIIFPDERVSVEHFRPRGRARGERKTVKENHYWWLTYEWRNMYYACMDCNRYKGSWFPVLGEYCEEGASYEEIATFEKPLLIDPCVLEPSEHLKFELDGRVVGLSAQGKITIDILQLNRERLVLQRLDAIQYEFGEWEVILKYWNKDKLIVRQVLEDWSKIKIETSPKDFLAARQALIKDRLESNAEINSYFNDLYNNPIFQKPKKHIDYLSQSKNIDFEPPTSKKLASSFTLEIPKFNRVYLSKLELENFRCFSGLLIEFPNKPQTIEGEPEDINVEPWFSILGENGVGKSTILQAVSLALAGHKYLQEHFRTNNFLKDQQTKGYIKLWLVGETKPITVDFSKSGIQSSLKSPICYCLAYGSVRIIEEENNKPTGPISILNLFNPRVELFNPNHWIYDTNMKTFDQVARSMKNLLNLNDKYRIVRDTDKKRLILSDGSSDIFVETLSEGYKSIIYLCMDIIGMFIAEKEEFAFDQAEGIVLIDELGTHLHPRWKMEVVEKLRTTFPRLQFIVTTHEPLCLVGVHEGEVVSLLRDSEENILLKTALPSPSSMRVDQILTSEFFGLNSTIHPKMDRLFNEYYRLLAIPDQVRTTEEMNRITELQPEINKHNHLGNSLREELAYFVIDELLAKKIKNQNTSRASLEGEILARVQKMWKSLE